MSTSSRLLYWTGWACVSVAFSLGSLGLELGCGDSTQQDCIVGAESCDCTDGGGCDPGLECLSGKCVDTGNQTTAGPSGGSESAGSSSGGTTPTSSGSNSQSGTSDASATLTSSGPTSDPSDPTLDPTTGNIFDVGSEMTTGDNGCVPEGCKKIDMLFALDHSGSMTQELNALAATQAFSQVVDLLEDINCGDIDYRIGVTSDNDDGFVTPNNWNDPNPWFDSLDYNAEDIANAFSGATSKLFGLPMTPAGCEHVLSSSVALLQSDNTGFVREDALLVLVLITDVDDYGWYDQFGQAPEPLCQAFGCQQSGLPVTTLQLQLEGLKMNDATGVATIVVAGDPSINGGVNSCGQPGTCCGGFECNVFHAERLWEFADIQDGMNGYTANLCDGPQSVPAAVQDALNNNIDLACQGFEPPT